MTLYEITECEHGELDEHRIVPSAWASMGIPASNSTRFCPGGVRREVSVDTEAMWRVLRAAGCSPTVGLCEDAIDAALGRTR